MTSNHVFYRLRSEVERLEVSSQETLLTQQAKHNLEISGLKEQLDESERRLRASDMDMASLREKLDQARLDSLQVRILIFFSKKKGEKHGLNWLKMHLKHNLLFFFLKKSVENDPPDPPQVWNFPLFFLTGSLNYFSSYSIHK